MHSNPQDLTSETSVTRERKTLDGCGQPINDDDPYYVQDTRTVVGNCGMWWANNSRGYCCNLEEAGIYTGAMCKYMRDTDVPWPQNYVRAHAVTHVRVDNRWFERRDNDVKKVKR